MPEQPSNLPLFCSEAELIGARQNFEDAPTSKTFAFVLACQVLHDAQQFVTKIHLDASMKPYCLDNDPNVMLFESLACIWSALSFDVKKMVRYEFEPDREAVWSAMLAGFNTATASMRNGWFGFYPHKYALHRAFRYPQDAARSAQILLGVFKASNGHLLPLSPEEIDHELADSPSDLSESLQSTNMLEIFLDVTANGRQSIRQYVSRFIDCRQD